MHETQAVRTTRASRDVTWGLLADLARWDAWGPWQAIEVRAGGEVGAVRALTARPITVVEEITAFEPRERLAYRLLSGLPVEGYTSEVVLADAPGGGTEVRWTSRYAKANPLVRAFLRYVVADVTKRLVQAADRAAG